MNDPTLENVPEKLRSAREIAPDIPNVILDFAEYMADIAMTKEKYHCTFIPELMWILVFDAKDHLYVSEGIRVPFSLDVPVPEKLNNKLPEILCNWTYIYRLIDKISSKEFAMRFRSLG